jgi:pimeloyl-ACP methyl ester carboxylesterase
MHKKKSLLKKTILWISTILLAFLLIISLGVWLSPGELTFDSPYHPFKTKKAKDEYLKLYDERAKKWPVIPTTKMINTSYGKTFVRISGPESAAPLVLMHGVGGNSLQWMSNVESLSKYYRVYAVDNVYDNGRSIPGKVMRNADDYIDWLNELYDELGLHDRINMAGLSYGGWLTAQYALKFPNRLNKIVLLAPAGTVAQLSPGWIIRAIFVAIPFKLFSRNFIYWLAEDTVNSGEKGRALIEEHVDETFVAARSFKAKQLVNPNVLTDEELQSIKIPTLFLVGENEKIYSPHEALERLNRVAPQIQTKLILHAGHDLTMVEAETVNKLIIEFINQKILNKT